VDLSLDSKRALLTGARAVAIAAVAVVTRVEGVIIIPVGRSMGVRVIGSIVVSIRAADVWIAISASRVINSLISGSVGIAE
jgi:hypothetical protein